MFRAAERSRGRAGPARKEIVGMMVLVDTSVWVRALGRRDAVARTGLDELLRRDAVAGHPLVYGELLIGVRGGRHKLLQQYELYAQLPVVPHADVVSFARQRGLMGRGLSWIDCHLLAAAVVNSVWLWSADTAVIRAAESFGVAFEES
jgi:predicted nucleic acid-binding protein